MKPVVAIVGGGIFGAWLAYYLASGEDFEVLLFEKGRCGEEGATGSSGGILRAFHRDYALTRMAAEGISAYRSLAVADPDGFRIARTGFLYMLADPAGDDACACADWLHSKGMRAERMDAGGMARRFPRFRTEGIGEAVFEPDAGYVRPAAAARSLLRLAASKGARIMENRAVDRLVARGDSVKAARVEGRNLEADCFILCAGAWSHALAAGIGISLPLRCRAIQNIRYHAPGALPAFYDEVSGLYGRPTESGLPLLGPSFDEWDMEPGPPGAMAAKDIQRTLALAGNRIEWEATPRIASSLKSFDAYGPEVPLDFPPHPEYRNLWIAAGLNGGGVKMAPYHAERLAARIRSKTGARKDPAPMKAINQG